MLVLLLWVCSCPGCYNKTEINQTIAAVAQGWDISPGGDAFLFTVQYALPPKPAKDGQTAPKFLVRTGRGATPASAERSILLELPRKPVWTLADTILIGENIARLDITLFTDRMGRSLVIREGASVFLAYQCTPEDILKIQVPPEDTTGVAVQRLIRGQQNQLTLYRPVTTSEFLRKISSAGIEPVLPQVVIETADGKEQLKLNGLAVFRGRQMVGSLSEFESRGYRFLTDASLRGGLFSVPAPGIDQNNPLRSGLQHTLKMLYSQVDVKPLVVENQLVMQIHVTAEGNLYELASTDYKITTASIAAIEQSANDKIRQYMEACIQKAQLYQSDILGWGEQIQHTNPMLWEQLGQDWPAAFSTLPYQVDVDYRLRRTYLPEDPVDAQ